MAPQGSQHDKSIDLVMTTPATPGKSKIHKYTVYSYTLKTLKSGRIKKNTQWKDKLDSIIQGIYPGIYSKWVWGEGTDWLY